jgi:hypothetical protein
MIFIHVLSAVAFLLISIASDALAADLPFNPREYSKKIVTCPAINRAQNTQVDINLRTGFPYWILWHMEEVNLIWNTGRLR